MQQPGFQADIEREPDALEALLHRHAGLTGLDAGRVLLIGMGSSQFAAQSVAALLRGRGIDAHVELASAAAPFPPSRDTVAIGISASGASPETVEALARHHGISQTITITNAPDGPLAAYADDVIALGVGAEEGGIACRSFQATLAVLSLLAGIPADRLRPAIAAARDLVVERKAWLGPLVDLIGDGPIYTIAPYERLSSALQSALMFREAPRLPADGCETGDWLHVDLYLTKRAGYTALLFTGSRYDAEVMRWARERAARIVAVGTAIEGAALHVAVPHDPLVAVLVETMVAELTASEIWRRRLAAGTMP